MKWEDPAARVPSRLAICAAVLLAAAHPSAAADAGASTNATAPRAEGKGTDDKGRPVPQPAWSFASSVLRAPATPDPGRTDELKVLLAQIDALTPEQITGIKDGVPIKGPNGKPVGPSAELVRKLYTLLPFEMVRQLAGDGLTIRGQKFQLKPGHNAALSAVREQMINEVYRMMGERYGMDFTRIDSGNKDNGVKSDVDHTAHAAWEEFERALAAKGEKGDIREAFERMYRARWGITQAECDICTHSGKNRIPDWRHGETVAEYDAKMREVTSGLIGTPGAYFQEGAWRIQAELRSAAAARQVTEQLHAIMVKLNQAGLSAVETAKLEAEKAKILEGNPCTRFVRDPKTGKVEVSRDISMPEALTGASPDILKPYAFDSCVGNFLFYLNHPDKWRFPQYPLRSFEEGAALLRHMRKGESLQPLRYGELTHQERYIIINELYPDNLGYDEARRKQIKRVLDIAADLRANHKALPEARRPEAELFKPIVEYLKQEGRGDGLDEAKLIEIAKQEYERSSVEMMVLNNERTAPERAGAWIEPAKYPELLKLIEGQEGREAKITKLQFASYYALKLAFRYLTRVQVNRIISSQTDPRYKRDLKILDDVINTELRLYGRTLLEPAKPGEPQKPIHEQLMEVGQNIRKDWEKSYKDFWVAVRDNHYSPEAVTERVWENVYQTLGFERKVAYELLKVRSSRWGDGVFEVKTGAPEWKVENALGNLINAGNALSAINVVRVYQQGGDRDEVIGAVVWEGLYRLPGVVHLMAARDAYNGDWHGVKFLATSKIMDVLHKYAADRGFGWAAPVGGHCLIYFMVAKGAIEILGYEIFEPLTSDAADLMYQGRIARPTPPPEFTGEDGQRLATLNRLVEKNREKMLNVDFKSAEMKRLVDETRGYLASVRELEAKQKAWQAHQKALERYDAGFIRPGIKDPVEAPFDPILHEKNVPLKFFIGSLDGDAGGPVDLEAKPLTEQERNRAENLRLTTKGLQADAQGLELPDRVDRLCGAMDELDELEEREQDAARAGRYLEKIRSDPEWMINALRQNLVFALRPIVDEKMKSQGYPPASEMANRSSAEYVKYAELRDKAAISAASQYAQKWFDEQHPQTKNLAGLADALHQVKARMIGDYQGSVDAREEFENFQLARNDARRERQKQRRAFLANLAVQDAMKAFLAKGSAECADYGFMVMAGGAPHEPKGLVKLTGFIHGEGENKAVKFRVKVIASTFQFQEPYEIEIKSKGGKPRSDGTKEVLLFAEVHDAAGKKVGVSEDIPASLRQGAGPVAPSLAMGVCNWGNTQNFGVFEGVVVSVPPPEPAKDAASVQGVPALGDRYAVYRARSPEGPWLRLHPRVYRDAPFLSGPGSEGAQYKPDPSATLDDFPSVFSGPQRWFYTALPKSGGAGDAGVPAELAPDQAGMIEVNVALPPPELKAGVARVPGKLTPDEASEKEARERQQAQGAAPAASSPEADKLKAEVAGFFGKREEQEGWISWSQPALPPPLDKTPTEHIFVELSFTAAPGEPERRIGVLPAAARGLNIDAYEPGWIWPAMAVRAGLFPGMPFTLKARWIVRTFGGVVASEWREFRFTTPLLRRAGDGSNGDVIRLAAGQAIQITCFKVVVAGDEKEGFTAHGPEGMNEGEHRAYTEKKRQEAVESFWKYYDSPADQQGERHAKLQKEIDKQLKKNAWQRTDWQKAHARLPGAPLGALIGEFVSDTARKAYDKEQQRKRAAAAQAPAANAPPPAAGDSQADENIPEDPFADRDKGPAAVYFLIGKGATFAAPEAGQVRLIWNWPVHGAHCLEYMKQLLYTVGYTNAGKAPPAPVPGSPRWDPIPKESGGTAGRWKFELPVAAAAESVELSVFAAAEEHGPWHDVPFDRQADRSLVIKDGGLAPGHRAWYRTRAVERGSASYATESWSPPVEVRLDPKSAELAPDGRASFFGKRNQTLRLKVQGQWQPLQVEGANLPYGADGIEDDALAEPLQKKLDAQFEENKKKQGEKPPYSREQAQKELDEFRAQRAKITEKLKPEETAQLDQMERGLEAYIRGDNSNAFAAAMTASAAPPRAAERLRQLRGDLELPAAPFGCLIAIFEVTPPLPGGDLYQRPRGFSAPETTVFRAGADWVFQFPEDGVVNLVPNRFKYDRKDPLLVRGAGQLTIDASLSPRE